MSKELLPRAPQRITTGFAFSYVDRAIREGLSSRRFGKAEMAKVVEYFGSTECVYCGSQPIARWDHLVPVKLGGDTVLGNMVPACSRCDDSKQHHAFDVWMKSNATHSPSTRGVADIEERIQALLKYASVFRYHARPLHERCPANELASLQERIQCVREEIETFICKHRAATS